MNDYTRVIPRDLFNEAKLLKCLGQLALGIHEGAFGTAEIKLVHNDDEFDGFLVKQYQDDGSLYASNLTLYVRGSFVVVSSIYNSKSPFPLTFLDQDTEAAGYVFDDDGTPSDEFLAYLGIRPTE